jgi:hypothetical protein
LLPSLVADSFSFLPPSLFSLLFPFTTPLHSAATSILCYIAVYKNTRVFKL